MTIAKWADATRFDFPKPPTYVLDAHRSTTSGEFIDGIVTPSSGNDDVGGRTSVGLAPAC
jgi:hypothetical protein